MTQQKLTKHRLRHAICTKDLPDNFCSKFGASFTKMMEKIVGSMWEANEFFVALIQMAKWKNSENHPNSCGIWVRVICFLLPIQSFLEPDEHLFTQKICASIGT